MKILMAISLLLVSLSVVAQSPAEQLSEKIAQKMKDTLSLSDDQKTQIYAVNMQLHVEKQQKFVQYKGTDSLRIHIQRIENTRDTLYSVILSGEKYLLYKQKKKDLVNNN